MTYRFPIKEIALQAGLGTATVDRVLNNRAHVSPQTRARVQAAIKELEGQESQLAARGRRMFFDVVIEAPQRFSHEVKRAAEAVLPDVGAAVCRPRFLLQEIMRDDEVVAALQRIAKRGSQGVCLKARDVPSIRAAVDQLAEAGIPVVTLVTDIPASKRIAYVGLDNESAGRTAAYLMGASLKGQQGRVLISRSQSGFYGEEERALGFTRRLAQAVPKAQVLDVSGGSGVAFETKQALMRVLSTDDPLLGVYSTGGGNRAILGVLDDMGLSPQIYVGHDLDRENRALLAEGRVTYVLYHDLQVDMRNVFQFFLQFHRLTQQAPEQGRSRVEVITPENMPAL